MTELQPFIAPAAAFVVVGLTFAGIGYGRGFLDGWRKGSADATHKATEKFNKILGFDLPEEP